MGPVGKDGGIRPNRGFFLKAGLLTGARDPVSPFVGRRDKPCSITPRYMSDLQGSGQVELPRFCGRLLVGFWIEGGSVR